MIGGSTPEILRARAGPGPGRVLLSALVAAIVAGAAGLLAVFGRGLIEAPGLFVVGFFYSIIPALLGLLLVHWLCRNAQPGTRHDLLTYASLSALIALLWLIPFVGLFVPMDGPNAWAAIGGLAVYHAGSGAIGGIVFWLLTRRGFPN